MYPPLYLYLCIDNALFVCYMYFVRVNKKEEDMPQEIKTTVYTYEELKVLGNDKATSFARGWLAERASGYDWWEPVYDDAKTIGGEIRGFELDCKMYIDFRHKLDTITTALRIRKNHGKDCATYELAMKFIGCYDEYHGVNGKITLNEKELDSLRDVKGGQERFDVVYKMAGKLEAEWETIEADFTHALGDEYLSMLRREWVYINSEEYLSDMAEANEYTFTADGRRFG